MNLTCHWRVTAILTALFLFLGNNALAAVGSVEGAPNVSGGAAAYNIPIAVPPGRNGLSPKLSLNYSSHSANGRIGVGWSLDGFSVIHRCPQTWAQDSTTDGVSFDANDRFCLDGKRLLLATGTYGAAGSTYRTEVDEFARITAHGQSGSGPSYFYVEAKSGLRYWYGNSVSSKIEAQGSSSVLFWAVNKVQDRANNYMWLSYGEDNANGEYWPANIHYSYPNLGSDGLRKVSFIYDTARSDVTTGYLGGSKRRTLRRLKNIKTYVGSRIVRDYQLDYQLSPATGRSLVSTITECAYDINGANADCVPATDLDYQGQTTALNHDNNAVSGLDQTNSFYQPVDLNGDGKVDLIADTGNLVVLWGQEGGYSAPQSIPNPSGGGYDSTGPTIDYNLDGRTDFTTIVVNSQTYEKTIAVVIYDGVITQQIDTGVPVNAFSEYYILDVNGDGKQDILTPIKLAAPCSNCEHWEVYLRTASGFTKQASPVGADNDYDSFVIDIDGDGRQDMLVREAGVGTFRWLRSTGNQLQRLGTNIPVGNFSEDGFPLFADVNGDSLVDAVISQGGRWKIMLNKGDSTGQFAAAVDSGQNDAMGPNNEDKMNGWVRVLDYDGDGRQDLLVPNNRTYNFPNSCPAGGGGGGGGGPMKANTPELKDTLSAVLGPMVDFYFLPDDYEEYLPGSLEVRPLDDLLNETQGGGGCNEAEEDAKPNVRDRYEWDVLRSTGTGFTRISNQAESTPLYIHVSDFTFDGRVDVLGRHTAQTASNPDPDFELYVNAGPKPDLLKQVTNGLGAVTEFDFLPLGEPSVYSVNHAYAFPSMNFASTMHVVQEMRNSNGMGGMNALNYFYENARFHRQGRGFQGFEAIEITDNATGVKTRTEFHVDFPLAGRIKRVASAPVSGNFTSSFFSETINTWNHATSTGGAKRVYLSASNSQRKKLTGFAQYSTTSVTNTWDSYNNLTGSTTITEDAFTRHTQTLTHNISNDTGAWWLGKVNNVTNAATIVHKIGPLPDVGSTSTASRFETFTYTSQRQLDLHTVEPGDPLHELKTDYGYDGYGNVTSVTVSSSAATGQAAIASRTSSTDYEAGRYFTSSQTNALGHVDNFTHDPATGLMLTHIDPNGVQTTNVYDNFGRAKSTTPAPSPTITSTYANCDPVSCTIANSAYKVTTTQQGRPTVISYYDRLNRELGSDVGAFTAGWNRTTVEYDAAGRVSRQSEPHDSLALPAQIKFTAFNNYDALGRAAQKVSPNGMVTNYAYDGLDTNIDVLADARVISVARTHNSLGNLVITVDALGTPTHYRNDEFNNPVLIEDNAVNRNTAVYTKRGFKTSMNDPNLGTWTFEYSVLGELKRQTDAVGNKVRFQYDLLGRKELRYEEPINESETLMGTWTYDGPGGVPTDGYIGQLEKVYANGSYGNTDEYDYDGDGRLVQRTARLFHGMGQHVFSMTHTYDGQNRLESLTYPTGFGVDYVYNPQGYLAEERNAANAAVLRKITAQDPRNNITGAEFGNGLRGNYFFDPASGLVESVCVATGIGCSGTERQHIQYEYDGYLNMTSRDNLVQSLREEFTDYDDLHRLKASNLSGYGATNNGIDIDSNYSYNAHGSFVTKSDYGNYFYDQTNNAGPHAVTRVVNGGSTRNYQYDANGNLTQVSGGGATRTIAYDLNQKPLSLTRDNATTEFSYSPDGSRWRQVNNDPDNNRHLTTYYFGKAFEYVIKTENGATTYENRHYVGDYLVYTTRSGASSATTARYLHGDHLGSVDTITTDTGGNYEVKGFDAFGKPRAAWSDEILPGVVLSDTTNRGFTAHEHLDSQGLIHMNGRAYDPYLGRFLSVDPFIQFPENSQSLNPYSYILNNPLSGTDPTGYVANSHLSHGATVIYGPVVLLAVTDLAGQTTIVEATSDNIEKLDNEVGTDWQSIATIGAHIQSDIGKGSSQDGSDETSGGSTLADNFTLKLASGFESEKYNGELKEINDSITKMHELILEQTSSNLEMHSEVITVLQKGVDYVYIPKVKSDPEGVALGYARFLSQEIELYRQPTSRSRPKRSRDPWGEVFHHLDGEGVEFGPWGKAKFFGERTIIHEFRHLMPENRSLQLGNDRLSSSIYKRSESDARRFTRFVRSRSLDFSNYSVPEKRR